MAERKEFRDYRYLPKEDYDKKLKINGEKVPLYSKDQLEKLYPEKDYVIKGETWEKKKRDKEQDIGRMELSQKWLYVSESGKHKKLFRKPTAYAAVEGGGFISLLRLRLLPFLILLAILLAGVGIGWIVTRPEGAVKPVDPDKKDPNIVVSEDVYYTISGTVTKEGEPVEGAVLSLQKGNEKLATITTGVDGAYQFEQVSPGVYNVVCTVGDSVLTKLADVVADNVIVDFHFPADDLHDVEDITDIHEEEKLPVPEETKEHSEVKAIVRVDENTPPIAVGGLDIEAMLHMVVGKEVDLTLLAKQLEDTAVPPEEKAAIEAISGDLTMTYYDFSLLKEIFKNKQLESSEYLTNTRTVLEIAVPFDSSRAAGTYVFRYHGGEAFRLEQLTEKPTGSYRDGTYYATIDTVYIYTDCFSTYAIGYADAGAVTQGSDMLIFSDGATVNVAEEYITMYYSHDKNATHNASVELYLVGKEENLLIAQSGIIPPGNELSVMPLVAKESNLPSDASYEGLMRIIYLGADGKAADTNVELPVTVTIVR